MTRKLVLSIVFLASTTPALAAKLTVQKVQAMPGQSVQAEIRYDPEGFQGVGIQFDLLYDMSAISVQPQAGPAASAANKGLSAGDPANNRLTIILAGFNVDVIGEGVVVTLAASVDSAAAPGEYPLQLAEVKIGDSSGARADVTTETGSITVGPAAPQGEVVLRFAQYANGEALSFENSTRVILRNNGDQAEEGEIAFRDSAGLLRELPIGGMAQSRVPFSVPSWGSTEVVTDGTGDLVVGSIEVTSNLGAQSKLEGTEIFELLGNNVSVNSSPLLAAQQVYVSVNSEENTGLAAYNPGQDPVALDLILFDHMGVQRASAELTVAAGGQIARFLAGLVDGLFPAFFDANPEFRGTLNIYARDGQRIVLLGLIQKASGALLAVPVSPTAPDLN